jgi:endonuclease/exonuclease/phosphatase family metal-dependent hydrolase
VISFLFWNVSKNPRIAPILGGLAVTYAIDLFLLAESPDDLPRILEEVNVVGRGHYQDAGVGIQSKVKVLSRLPEGDLVARFTNPSRDMTIWSLRATAIPQILLAAVHLPAKVGGVTPESQFGWAQDVAREIREIEDQEQCRDTVLVGDLNMNPYEQGVVNVMALHALMTKDLTSNPDRLHRGREFRRFYNPMWGLFGDRTPGPAGTHLWDTSVPNNHHWYILDQVLLRPSLMNRLLHLQILDGDGTRSYLANGYPRKDHVSDHLPLLFQLDL